MPKTTMPKSTVKSVSKTTEVEKKTTLPRSSKQMMLIPVLENASKMVQDTFWKDILIKASKGNFGKNFVYIDGFLKSKASGRFVEISNDPSEALHSFISFYKKEGYFSIEDKVLKQGDYPINSTWDAFSKKDKGIILDFYIDHLKVKYNLSFNEHKKVNQHLLYALKNNCLSDYNVTLDQYSRIIHIDGLEYIEDKKTFSFSDDLLKQPIDKKSRSVKKQTKVLMSKNKTPLYVDKYNKYMKLLSVPYISKVKLETKNKLGDNQVRNFNNTTNSFELDITDDPFDSSIV